MALSQAIPDSFNDAKEVFRESLINLPFYERVNHQLIEEILQKHPDLVNCEYKQELLDRIPKLVDLEYKKVMDFMELRCFSHVSNAVVMNVNSLLVSFS